MQSIIVHFMLYPLCHFTDSWCRSDDLCQIAAGGAEPIKSPQLVRIKRMLLMLCSSLELPANPIDQVHQQNQQEFALQNVCPWCCLAEFFGSTAPVMVCVLKIAPYEVSIDFRHSLSPQWVVPVQNEAMQGFFIV